MSAYFKNVLFLNDFEVSNLYNAILCYCKPTSPINSFQVFICSLMQNIVKPIVSDTVLCAVCKN